MVIQIGDPFSVTTQGYHIVPTSGGVDLDVYIQKLGVHTINFKADQIVQINGNIETNVDLTNATIAITINKISDDTVINTPLSTSSNFTANTAKTLKAINGGNNPSWTASNGNYYAKVSISHAFIQNADNTCWFAVGHVGRDVYFDETPTVGPSIDKATIFSTGFNLLINKFGKSIKVEDGNTDCPNCGFSPIKRKSNGIYNDNNPNELGSELNRPFTTGAICPVCSGKGRIISYTTIIALVNWVTHNNILHESLELSSRRCEIKVHNTYYDTARKAKEFRIPIHNGEFVNCTKVTEPRGLGIGPHRFCKFYVEAKV